jgi:hypothetical protein
VSWFRLYTDILNDPKVQTLPPDLFKTWVGILCITKDNGGTLPAIETVAFQLRFTSVSSCFKAIENLIEAGLIDKVNGTTLAPHNWRKRQYISDVSTIRVQRFRERQRNVSETPPETELQSTETEKKNTNSVYAFAGNVIKLKADAFQAWKEAFAYLSLTAELIARDAWLAGQSEAIRKNWFQSTAAYLAKKNREARAERERAPPDEAVEMFRTSDGKLMPVYRG